MPTTLSHRRVNIVTLTQGETISEHCRAGDIALVQDEKGWWPHFVGEGGLSDTYDEPFPSYNQALWAAKAAAEYASAEE